MYDRKCGLFGCKDWAQLEGSVLRSLAARAVRLHRRHATSRMCACRCSAYIAMLKSCVCVRVFKILCCQTVVANMP